MKLRYLLPLFLFAAIALILWRGLSLHPNQIPSPLINKAAPLFSLPTLENAKAEVSNKNFLGHVTLLNVWASWCFACAEEHEYLLQIAKQQSAVLIGLNYKDNPAAAKQWLHEHGNPYAIVASDTSGDTAINWGVYGAPETFIIDKKGRVRYKQIGAITPQVWVEHLQPLITQLQAET